MLTKVKNFWVKGVLEKSLHQQVLISLGLEERPEAIASPWNMMQQTEEQQPREIPPGTSVISVFDQIGAGRTLLILGEPGSGKTISLLQLARDLIERAEQEVDQLIPVIFNLSSWKPLTQHQPLTLADWLIAELNNKYQVPKRQAKDWVEKQQLCLLLDGLDEVQPNYKDECVTFINIFLQNYSTEMVVCSRIKFYETLRQQLNLQMAICIRPLTSEQINNYLDYLDYQVEGELKGIRIAFQANELLQGIIKSPLMLMSMVLAYQELSVEKLLQMSMKEQLKRLFKILMVRYPKKYLNQTERRQWRSLWQKWIYYTVIGLIFGLAFGLFLSHVISK